MRHSVQKLSFREKVGYSLGDSGANFVFQTLMIFQMTFYTNVFGITAAAAGLLFLVGRVSDAITDPLMGVIADRTKTRWGRFRPWLIWSAVPFAVIFWLAFTTPDWSSGAKLAYAWITYLLLMAVYTVNNVPYAALNGVMTGDVNERTSLSTFRFVAAMSTAFIVQGLTWPLVGKFGGGNDAKGWSITMGIFAAVCVVFFIITFFSVKERVQPDPNQQSSVKQDIKDAFNNRPWVVLFFATLLIFIMLSVRGGSQPLFTQHIVDHVALTEFLRNFGVIVPEGAAYSLWQHFLDIFGLIVRPDAANVANVGFGLIAMMGNAATIIGVFLSKPLSERFGKRGVFVTCLFLTAAANAWLFFIPGDAIQLQFAQGILSAAVYGPTIPLLWSMIADAADFSEWKTGRRATGFVFAGIVFALKAGLGLGGFLGGMVLAAYGFQSGAEQTADGLLGIRYSVAIYPAAAVAIAAVILLWYPIGKELNLRIGDELQERRREREKHA